MVSRKGISADPKKNIYIYIYICTERCEGVKRVPWVNGILQKVCEEIREIAWLLTHQKWCPVPIFLASPKITSPHAEE